MIEVLIRRAWADSRATLGMLTIKGVQHDPIFTLENPQRETSIDSRIPGGFYRCEPFNGAKYKDVYEIKDVPGRTNILFHWGNFEKDTLGCILIGNQAGIISGMPAVLNSVVTFQEFRKIIGKKSFDLTIV